MLCRGLYCRKLAVLLLIGAALAGDAFALPFNDDMVKIQPRTGVFMRPKALGSIPLGALSYRLEKKEDAANLSNPLKNNARSANRGKRLYDVNCLPCHGDINRTPWQVGSVGEKLMLKPPDITTAYYREGPNGRSDGYLYGTIHFGGLAIMPALGWKLSPTEHWDVVNYIRKVQLNKQDNGE